MSMPRKLIGGVALIANNGSIGSYTVSDGNLESKRRVFVRCPIG